MTLSAAHRPLNPPFRRAPGASVKTGRSRRRHLPGSFWVPFCGKKVQNTRDDVADFSVLLMAKVPKPSACRFRGNNLRPALSGCSKNKTMQPPAPGTRAVGCSCSAASENADFSRRVSRRTTRQSKTAISTFCGKKVQRSLAGEDRGCPRSAASDNAEV